MLPGFNHADNHIEKSLVRDLSPQNVEQYFVINVWKEFDDVCSYAILVGPSKVLAASNRAVGALATSTGIAVIDELRVPKGLQQIDNCMVNNAVSNCASSAEETVESVRAARE